MEVRQIQHLRNPEYNTIEQTEEARPCRPPNEREHPRFIAVERAQLGSAQVEGITVDY